MNEGIKNCIDANEMFLLEAGAGSGKTHTLVQTINYVQLKYPKRKIVCITYTNNAKDEIISRLINKNNITVSTIHDFIWGYIKQFQKELRTEVNDLILQKIVDLELANDSERLEKYRNADLNLKIQYKDYRALHKGIISHNDIIELAIKFLNNPIFAKMFVESFSYIFIDEYQDANKRFLPELLKCIKDNKRDNYLVLGLFGDSMQNIFPEGIGSVNELDFDFRILSKIENYRSCTEIIKFSNLLRSDGLEQQCTNEKHINKLLFIYNISNDKYLQNFDFGEAEFDKCKRLFLVHKQIAEEVGFKGIFDLYKEKYQIDTSNILKKADDRFLNYIVNKVMINVYKYIMADFKPIVQQLCEQEFTTVELNQCKATLDTIINNMDIPIKVYIEALIEKFCLIKSDFDKVVESYTDTNEDDFINKLFEINAVEFFNYYKQFSGETSLETMHGVKGNEYEDVVVNIEENTPWNHYNFGKLFLDDSTMNLSTKVRTNKILYVSCTRAKRTLIINYIVNANSPIFSKEQLKSKVVEKFGDKIVWFEYQ